MQTHVLLHRSVYLLFTYFFFFFNFLSALVLACLRVFGSFMFTMVMFFRIDWDVYMRGLEGWDIGRCGGLEGWDFGRCGGLEGWDFGRCGGLEGWKCEGLEGWDFGKCGGWRDGTLVGYMYLEYTHNNAILRTFVQLLTNHTRPTKVLHQHDETSIHNENSSLMNIQSEWF